MMIKWNPVGPTLKHRQDCFNETPQANYLHHLEDVKTLQQMRFRDVWCVLFPLQ